MFTITKGYKLGRAVLFYDLISSEGNCAKQMVSKDNVVQLCTDGQISNAKIQWWEGKPIVRCNNKNLPLVRVDEKGNVIGVAKQAVRNKDKDKDKDKVDIPHESIADKAVEVGKLTSRKPKRDISYKGYDTSYVLEKHELYNSVDLTGLKTIGDLFDYIAKDFRVRQADKYKNEFGKKIKLDRDLSSINSNQLKDIQCGVATYLMNMVYEEVSEVYNKWR